MKNNTFLKSYLLSIVSLILSLVSCFLFLGVPHAKAASVFFETPSTDFSVNQDIKVDVIVNSEGQGLNAFEGAISFPSSILSVKQIREGDSIIGFWIERPHLSSSTNPNIGTIAWSGITPGGFHETPGLSSKKRGNLFSIIFSPKKTGDGRIAANNVRILLEDGLGTPAKVSSAPLSFKIGEYGITASIPKDTYPPEEFRPQVTSDPSIFDNQSFLAFAANDKESGIDHYEILETWFNNIPRNADWITAESPYLLKDQTLGNYVFVKAVDKSGNYRIQTVSPIHPEVRYKYYFLWSIIILGILVAGSLLWKKLKRK